LQIERPPVHHAEFDREIERAPRIAFVELDRVLETLGIRLAHLVDSASLVGPLEAHRCEIKLPPAQAREFARVLEELLFGHQLLSHPVGDRRCTTARSGDHSCNRNHEQDKQRHENYCGRCLAGERRGAIDSDQKTTGRDRQPNKTDSTEHEAASETPDSLSYEEEHLSVFIDATCVNLREIRYSTATAVHACSLSGHQRDGRSNLAQQGPKPMPDKNG